MGRKKGLGKLMIWCNVIRVRPMRGKRRKEAIKGIPAHVCEKENVKNHRDV